MIQFNIKSGKIIFLIILSAIFSLLTLFFFLPGIVGSIQNSLPKTVRAGVESKASIKLDHYGIPHIYAKNKKDLFYAYGYFMASERLFQMELQRRLSKGELSELFGPSFIEIDKLFRTLRLDKYLQTNWQEAQKKEKIPQDLETIIDAFLRGVNDYILRDQLPIEFFLIQSKPKLFTLEDIHAFIGHMAYSFATSFKGGLLYDDLAHKISPEKLLEMRQGPKDPNPTHSYPHMGQVPTPSHLIFINNEYQNIFRTLRQIITSFTPFKGSNSWVVSGSKTKSGYPILANDPHISFSLPGVWFEAHLQSPDFEIYGHFLPLVPLAVIGHNQNYGWAMTMSKVDDMQFFEEKLNPNNPRRVLFNEKWWPIQKEDEIIKVKGGSDLHFPVERTQNGPLLHHILNKRKGAPLSLYWALYNSKNIPLLTLYSMNMAKDIHSFEQGLKHLKAPGLNISYADRRGNIAWWMVGEVAIKPKEQIGKMILAGERGVGQLDFLSFNENPRLINPPEGYIVSANSHPPISHISHPTHPDSIIEGHWQPIDRYKTIDEHLNNQKDLTISDMIKIQNNEVDRSAKTLLPLLLKFLNYPQLTNWAHEKSVPISLINKALKTLSEWDGLSDRKNVAQTIYSLWYEEILKLVLSSDLDQESLLTYCDLPDSWFFLNTIIRKEESRWWKNDQRSHMISEALIKTITFLKEQYGENPKKWNWGRIHTISFHHPLGKNFLLSTFFNLGPFPVGGGPRQVNNMEYDFCTQNFDIKWGPSTRILIDFANPKQSLGVLPLGNSGRRFSPHYQDQVELFLNGKYRNQLMDDELIKKELNGEITLEPR